MPVILWILIALAALVIGFILGIAYRKKIGEREIQSAEEEAKRIINESIKSAESKKKEALLEAKEENLKTKNELDKEVKERRAELQHYEKRVLSKYTKTAPSTSVKKKSAVQS